MLDTRLVLGIIALFCLTNILTFYDSFCHIMSYYVPPLIFQLSKLSLVVNSTFKFVIYSMLSKSFRNGVKSLFLYQNSTKDDEIEAAEIEKSPKLLKKK
jgi:hypothetical protein